MDYQTVHDCLDCHGLMTVHVVAQSDTNKHTPQVNYRPSSVPGALFSLMYITEEKKISILTEHKFQWRWGLDK